MDGFVTALLKSPFNQMCYAINKAEGISYKKKDYIITKATESNEHCKETLKKFEILTICGEVARIIVEGAKENDFIKRDGPIARSGLFFLEHAVRPMRFKKSRRSLCAPPSLSPLFFGICGRW